MLTAESSVRRSGSSRQKFGFSKRRAVNYFLLSLIIFLFFTSIGFAQYRGKVVGVSDGDTITVLADNRTEKVRLYGVDCPEKGQDFAEKAKVKTSELTFGKIVFINPKGNDRYGRTVGEVHLPDGQILNYELVKSGLCYWYRRYAPNDPHFAAAESNARANKHGVWSLQSPTPPWKYRRDRGTGQSFK